MLHLTDETFGPAIRSEDPLPVVVMFYADWCSKCAMMKPVAEEAERHCSGKIRFYKVDIEESEELSARYEADIVPTFLCFCQGNLLGVMQGVIEETLFEERLQKIFRNS